VGDNGTGTEVTNTTDVKNSADHTLYAKWSIQSYEVKFEPGAHGSFDASGAPDVQTIEYNSFATAPTVIEEATWTFIGWDKSVTAPITGPITFTAQYARQGRALTAIAYPSDGGLLRNNINGDYIFDSVVDLASAAPSVNTGWDFIGWEEFTAPNTWKAITGSTVTIDESNIFRAVFAKKKFTVTFVPGLNGTFAATGATTVQTVEYGASATAPTVIPNIAYNFTGWDKAFGGITSDLTVTAQYAVKTFTVTFNEGDNGTFDPDGADAVQTVNYGASATAPTVDSDTGYRFTGWSRGFANVKSNLTVTAEYAIRTYALTVNVQGNGTVSGIAGRYDYGETVDLGDAVTTPDDGYEFTGFVDAQGDDIYTVDMTANRTVTAVFSEAAPAPAPSPAATPSVSPPPSPSGSVAPVQTTIPENQLPEAAPASTGGQTTFSLYWLFLIIGLPLLLLLLFLLLFLKRKKDKESQPQG